MPMQDLDVLYYPPRGYVQLTGMSAATNLPSVPARTRHILITVEAQGVRWRDDGVAPTASVGMPLAAGQTFEYLGNANTIQFIQQVSGAILNVSYYG